MNKHVILAGLLSLAVFALMSAPSQAVFVQCPAAGCAGAVGSADDDVINGTPMNDTVDSGPGNDSIFGGDGNDDLTGQDDNDTILGGLNDDGLYGGNDNDILMAGPDTTPLSEQFINMGDGNDNAHVIVSEILGCLVIEDFGGGRDTVNLIGFGPYVAFQPFGQPDGFNNGFVQVIDPIAGGQIFIAIDETGDGAIEVINGLLSPNVTFVAVLPDTGCRGD